VDAQGESSPAAGAAGAPGERGGPTDPLELEAFLDDVFAGFLEDNHIVGAAVVVVKDGKPFFAKGYGHQDRARGVPVDPETTIFRIGSVSKLFTWTAVMQLVEQGKLDLDADVNDYLDFQIPDTYPEPITLRHLLAHTSGFEDRLLGSLALDPDDVMPVRDGIHALMPARIRAPGQMTGYANYNAILAGYIVARVAAQPYDEYVKEHILEPLGMAHSSAAGVTPEELRPDESVGYTYVDGAFEEYPEYALQPAGLPSGAMHASAGDMARFMLAFLGGGGTSGGARILESDTVRQMLGTLYTPDPRLRGMAYGFADMSDNGQRTLGHQGYFPPMHSQLLVLPDQRLGVFVSFNTQSADGLTTQHTGFQRAFFDHYYPAPPVTPVDPPADFAERASRYTGSYRWASAPATTLIKIVELFGAYRAELSDPGDGTLLLGGLGPDRRFAEVEPLFFKDVDGDFALVFSADDSGRITHAYTDLVPQYTLVRLHWYDAARFHMTLLLGCTLLFVSIVPVALMRAVRNRRRPEAGLSGRGASGAYRLLLVICLLNVAFVVGTVLWGSPPTELGSLTPIAKAVLGLGVAAAVLTLGAVACAVLAWLRGFWGLAFRSYYTLVTVAAVAFVWFLDYWNLLGWRY
jgi:CubicO group peptidase (beta-lactamase class C family)